MTTPVGEVLHVLGLGAPGDTTTAAARVVRDRLAAEGLPGRLVALQVHGTDDDLEVLRPGPLGDGPVVVHVVDGGEALAPVLGPLRRAGAHLIHHGSAPGSNRTVLRSLRGTLTAVAATDPAAREELRGLGFGEPVALPGHLLCDTAGPTVDALDPGPHPGPHLLALGPITEGRSLELLVDAFAQLRRSGVPSAILSICGPARPRYVDELLRRVLRRGLVACEVLEPDDEGAVRTRLARCDVFVSLQPAGLDPYLWRAAAHGAVVAPRVAATAQLTGSAGFVEVAAAPTRDQLVAAMHRAAAVDRKGGSAAVAVADPGSIVLRDLLRVA